MADVTISQLSQGTPNNSAAIPFSQDGTTYKVSPSSILEGAGPVFISGPGPGTAFRQYNTDLNPGLEIQNRRSGDWPGTSFLNAATATNLMVGNTETGTKLMFGQYSTAYSWIQNRNVYNNSNQVLMLQPEGGTVGIGLKTLPASTLHVNGTITASGLNVPGTILNIVQAVYNDESDVGTGPQGAGNSWTDVPGLTVSITPKFASSKFMLRANIHSVFNATTTCNFRFLKNGSPIGVGKAGVAANGTTPDDLGSFRGSTPNPSWCNPAMGEFLDSSSNTGAAITYKVQFKPYYFDNRTLRWNNSIAGGGGDRVRVISTLTVTEIAG